MGHWRRAPATFGHVPGGGLRAWRDGSAEEHGASRESDRRFRLYLGAEGEGGRCLRVQSRSCMQQHRTERAATVVKEERRGEERSTGGLPVGGKATFYEPLAAIRDESSPSSSSSHAGGAAMGTAWKLLAAPQVAANWDPFSLPPGSTVGCKIIGNLQGCRVPSPETVKYPSH